MQLSSPVSLFKGIGPRIAESLAERNVSTVEDLLYHLPFRYEDRANPKPLSEIKDGETASVIAEVRGSFLLRTRRMPLLEVTFGQGLATMKALWFRGHYLKDRFKPGMLVALHGKVDASRSGRGPVKMIQPQFEVLPGKADMQHGAEEAHAEMLEIGRVVPVYPTLGNKLGTVWIRRTIFKLLKELPEIPETLPRELLDELGLPSRDRALRDVHFAPTEVAFADLENARTPAHRRLIFEELFFLELGLAAKRRRWRTRQGIEFATGENVRAAIKKVLPFHPTAAQKKVFGEIIADMRGRAPMRRLLQGDVGSGKTIVAMEAAIVAIENGYQAALMAPTEILATQHYLSARKLLEPLGYTITLLTGSLDTEHKRRAHGRIARGEAQFIIGTHALIEEKVDFAKLGLIVVDEQHRFGVLQRFRLMKKPNAAEPDVLVMTATPIPRTLALTLYGDLDLSVLDEMPPGRTPIATRRIEDARANEVWEFVRKQVAVGHQAYIVYPVIEGSADDQPELDFADDTRRKPEAEGGDEEFTLLPSDRKLPKKAQTQRGMLKSAVEMADKLREGPLKGLRIGLLHGRMRADDKEITMRRFQRGELDVLVSTTVIEVGVDVPNATVMVIEHAERFGLAQMHQLRGRVGRGGGKSFCILMTGGAVSEQAEERLDAMVRTQNGFELAELDLQQRGPGEFFGTKQTGLPDFRVANLLRDRELLDNARRVAEKFIAEPQWLGEKARAAVAAHLKEHWQRRYGLVEA